MNIRIKPVLLLSTFMWLSGCCPNGCFVLTGDAYRALAYPLPMRDRWDRANTSTDIREQDWIECGGTEGGNFSPKEEYLNAEKQPVDTDTRSARSRLLAALERCMLKKEYRYTGKCYDNQISRESPACGAP